MQRRAAASYAGILLVIAIGAYAAITLAPESVPQERISGLWGVSILSGLTGIVLLGTAYLPSRY